MMILFAVASLVSGQTWPAPVVINATDVNGAARFTQDASGVTIGPVVVTGAYRAVETDAGVDTPDLYIRGLTATGLTRDGIRLRNAPNLLIEDFELRHSDTPASGINLPEGIAIYDGGGIIRRGLVSGFKMVPGSGYTNGDGIATEGNVDGLTIEDVVSSDNSDAGFDLKGRHITLNNITAERNSRGLRIWSEADVGAYTSIDNGTALWVGKYAVVTVQFLKASSKVAAQVISLEGSTKVNLVACDLTGMAPGSVLIKSNASGNTVTRGPGCRLP